MAALRWITSSLLPMIVLASALQEGQAVQKARQLVGGQDGELWDNDHLIARFPDAEKTAA